MYTKLRELHRLFGEQIEILLFPSDEFGRQELPSNQIPEFVMGYGLPIDGGGCTLMGKVHVNGPESDPVRQCPRASLAGLGLGLAQDLPSHLSAL